MVERRTKAERLREERISLAFQALADPSRRRMIELLREAGELTVGEIAKTFDMSLNGVSKHLKVLERSHLITRRIDGRTHYIRVDWQSLQRPYEWLHFYHHYWSGRIDKLVDYVAAASETTPNPTEED